MELDPFVWFVVGVMSVFAIVLGWATWHTRS
jgi:hypothetical protein